MNGDATAHLARACAASGVVLAYVSTDYVFAGDDPGGYTEDRPRDPVNQYGHSKARGEEAVEDLAAAWQIIRTSWLFGDGPVNFVRTIRRLLTSATPSAWLPTSGAAPRTRRTSRPCSCGSWTADGAAGFTAPTPA